MKKLYLLIVSICFAITSFAQNSADTTKPKFSPVIKFHGLIHSRFESSLTDSVDVQGRFLATPSRSNFRIRRLELRADIQLNSKWSGVIRIQFPDLKTPTPGRAIELAYFQFSPRDQFNIRGGQMKMPYELDELTSHEDLRMIDRGTTDRIFVANNLGSYQPGLMVYGTFLKATTPLSYYAGVFNGGDRSVPYDDNSGKNYVGRIEFSPVKSLRIAVNDQLTQVADTVTGNSFGVDGSLVQNFSNKMVLILEGEYIQGPDIALFKSIPDTAREDIDKYMMSGYFAQALLRINIMKTWCRTFEIGGKFERTDPWTAKSADDANTGNAVTTITGGIGFIFLPDNDARLQLNLIQTNYEKEIPGSLKNNLMFVTQLQLKI